MNSYRRSAAHEIRKEAAQLAWTEIILNIKTTAMKVVTAKRSMQ